MKTRLGRGLGALLSGGEVEPRTGAGVAGAAVPGQAAGGAGAGAAKAPGAGAEDASAEERAYSDATGARGHVVEIDLSRIQPNPHQPRRTFDSGSLEDLRNSIQNHGVLQPVVVRRSADGFELVAGERRWRASRLAGLERIPALVRPEVSDSEMLELALVENVQREDLDPIERARGYRQMIDRLNLKQDQVAQRVGLKRATVANHLRLLELPSAVQDAVAQGRITMGHARAILGLDGSDAERISLATLVASRDLSVRETERVVRERNRARRGGPASGEQAGSGSGGASTRSKEPWIRETEDRLRRALGTRVRVENRPGFKGQIVVEYYNRADLERLLAHLAPRPVVDTGPGDTEAR